MKHLVVHLTSTPGIVLLLLAWVATLTADTPRPCRITVVDQENGWPVPLVELKTTHNARFVTDNAGNIAFDLPELMGRETWFEIRGHGYEVPRDGFGHRGIRLTPQYGARFQVKVKRTNIAKRLGRVTGAGRFGESQKLGLQTADKESGVLGCDSVQAAIHRGRMFWIWGDTSIARYPLGIFHASGATTPVGPLASLEPPIYIDFDYFTDQLGNPRGVARMPGAGPTWITGCVSLPDETGADRLVATYLKIEPPLEAYERGLCVWNDESERFEHLRTLWQRSAGGRPPPPLPAGHAAFIERDGQRWVMFGNPLPALRLPATFEAWQDPSKWEELVPPEDFISAVNISAVKGAKVKPHAGSIAWNAYRQRWVTVFTQVFGKPSAFGEVWYAEASQPTGPWGPAVKILTHENYTFYNPRMHPDFTPDESPILLFEGTYSQQFADHAPATARYDYNQILYRLELDDARLKAAQQLRGVSNRED